MMDDRLDTDQSKIETISDSNSPMDVKDQYHCFVSQELLTVKEFIENSTPKKLANLGGSGLENFTLVDIIKVCSKY